MNMMRILKLPSAPATGCLSPMNRPSSFASLPCDSFALNSSLINKVPNTTNIGFEYVEGELILLHLSDFGICASSGSACTSGSLEPSHVLRAMGIPFTALHGSMRFSLSRFTKESDIDYVIEKMPAIMDKLTSISPFQDELADLRKRKSL